MAENSKIEWTHHTFNPWRGCAKVHEGCAHCYAEREAKRFPDVRGIWGPNGTRVVASESMWHEPVKWNRLVSCNVAHGGPRPRVFCASLADVFEDWHGKIVSHKRWTVRVAPNGHLGNAGFRNATMDDLRARLFTMIDATPNLDWLLVTKRPENVHRMWPWHCPCGNLGTQQDEVGMGRCEACGHEIEDEDCYRKNVWLLTSVSNQATADAMIPPLLWSRDLCPVLGLSAEPLLGPIEFSNVTHRSDAISQLGKTALSGIDWVIVGGESGHGARPCDLGWIRSIRDQCQAASVACFIKQLGANPIAASGSLRFLDKKGGDWETWPDDLRIRQYPKVSVP